MHVYIYACVEDWGNECTEWTPEIRLDEIVTIVQLVLCFVGRKNIYPFYSNNFIFSYAEVAEKRGCGAPFFPPL